MRNSKRYPAPTVPPGYKIRYFYSDVFDPFAKPHAATIAILMKGEVREFYGVSYRSFKDAPNHRFGRYVAGMRAFKAFQGQTRMSDNLELYGRYHEMPPELDEIIECLDDEYIRKGLTENAERQTALLAERTKKDE